MAKSKYKAGISYFKGLSQFYCYVTGEILSLDLVTIPLKLK